MKIWIATCHPDRPVQARGLCKSCYDKWLKSVNPEYKKAQKSNTARWIEKNPAKVEIIRNRRLAKLKKDPVLRRNISLRKKYGIDHKQYEQLLEAQGGGCALCNKKPPKGKHFHVDHCHKSGRIRGILCPSCNWWISPIERDKIKLYNLFRYLALSWDVLVETPDATVDDHPRPGACSKLIAQWEKGK